MTKWADVSVVDGNSQRLWRVGSSKTNVARSTVKTLVGVQDCRVESSSASLASRFDVIILFVTRAIGTIGARNGCTARLRTVSTKGTLEVIFRATRAVVALGAWLRLSATGSTVEPRRAIKRCLRLQWAVGSTGAEFRNDGGSLRTVEAFNTDVAAGDSLGA